jgi:DNA-directed RNA polymerase subunit omega
MVRKSILWPTRPQNQRSLWMPIEHKFDSHFRYVLVAARRARQLQQGSDPLVTSRSAKPHKMAQEEINAGLVGYIRHETPRRAEIEETIVPRFAS